MKIHYILKKLINQQNQSNVSISNLNDQQNKARDLQINNVQHQMNLKNSTLVNITPLELYKLVETTFKDLNMHFFRTIRTNYIQSKESLIKKEYIHT